MGRIRIAFGLAAALAAGLAAGAVPARAGAAVKAGGSPVVGLRVSESPSQAESFVAGIAGQQRLFAGPLSTVQLAATVDGGRPPASCQVRLSLSIAAPQRFVRSAEQPCAKGRWNELDVAVPAADAHAVASVSLVAHTPGGTTVDQGTLAPAPTLTNLSVTSPTGTLTLSLVGPSAAQRTTWHGAPALRLVGPLETLEVAGEPFGAAVASTCSIVVSGTATRSAWRCVPGQGATGPSAWFFVARADAPTRVTFRVASSQGAHQMSVWLLPTFVERTVR